MIVFAARACAILYDLLESQDDERPFLIPANICPIVPVTFLEAKRPFALIDIAEATMALDVEACLDRIRREPGRFGGILFARPYGSERDDATPFFRRLKELQPDLLLIDDKCLCRPDCEGASVSGWADATLFSTGYAKHVDLGCGGFAHVREDVPCRRHGGSYREAALEAVTRRYKRAVAERTPFEGLCEGWLDRRSPEAGWDEHGERTLAALHRADEHKRRLNAIYADLLPREIQLPPELQGWRFNIRVADADELVERLFSAGLFASRHYASLGGAFGEGRFPVAERLHDEVVNLFNDRYFDEERAERAARLVLRHLAGAVTPKGRKPFPS